MIFNLLYCFDQNYDLQAQSSIVSILDLTESNINIYVIHKDKKHFLEILNPYIKNHPNLNSINVFDFKYHNMKFKNLENAHVSEATYYRLYFDRLIPGEVNNLIYLDSDVICIHNPDEVFKNTLDTVHSSEFIIGVKTTFNRNSNPLHFEELDLKKDSYFNAGVMFIDVKKWRSEKIYEKIQTLLSKNLKLKFWDQDILNKVFDGKYFDIDKKLNEEIRLGHNKTYPKDYFKNVLLVHYSGKSKPWNNKGLFNKYNHFYHDSFRKFNSDYYHIEHVWIKLSIKYLISSLINKKFFSIKKKLTFLKIYIRNIFMKSYITKLIP